MKRRLAILIPAILLVLAACAAEPPPEPLAIGPATTARETQRYQIIPDEEFYPEGYIGYRYPVRPSLESWLAVTEPGAWPIQVPEDVIAGMSTEELAQSVVCYPWYGWQAEMMLSSQSEQPPDFVRGWFDRRYSVFPAMEALARRGDARQALKKLDGMYEAFSGPNHFNGIDPRLMLQSAQFGGPGIPDGAHKGGG